MPGREKAQEPDLEDGARPESVLLPTGRKVTYQYGNNLLPERIAVDGQPVLEYTWQDLLRLTRCRDLRTGTEYDFYNGEGERAPSLLTLRGPVVQRLGLCPRGGDSIDLAIVTDQVDSVRMLATEEGHAVSSIEYDSFGP